MDLLEKINTCTGTDEELTSIVDDALKNAIDNAEKKNRLGFPDGALGTAKIPAHKGFISPETRIKYENFSQYTYLMKTTDYFYDFAKYIKKNNINTKSTLVKCLEDFINSYFGISNGTDMRDNYFDSLTWDCPTDDEYFAKIENLEIGDLKDKNVAMCTERAALAQNLLSLFGFEIYYCMGCVNNDGQEESHCFNIVRAKNNFVLLDYSLPVSIFENEKLIGYVPFQGHISIDELEDVLLNGTNKDFSSYEYIKTPQDIKKVDINELRTYTVGNMTFEKTNIR